MAVLWMIGLLISLYSIYYGLQEDGGKWGRLNLAIDGYIVHMCMVQLIELYNQGKL